MTKCPKCSAEIEDGMKFCPECGERVPQTKECPQCHTQWPLSAKFCAECGHSFLTAQTAGSGGSFMGDKNVVAGDINVSNSSTTTNNTTNTYINQDESKQIVRCSVCERPIVITEALVCKECHQYVCHEHYDASTGCCTSCVAKKASDAEAVYRKELEVILEDGIIDKDEFDQLEVLRKLLGLSAPRAMELQKIMKAELSAKKSSARRDAPLMMVEKAQCERAKDLLFGSGRGQDAVKLLESIYQQHPLNEDVLSTYLAALFTFDEDRARSIITSLPVDMVRAYLVLFDIELKKGDLAAAEAKLAAAESLWPNNMLLKCRRAELMYATAIELDNRTYLAEAMDLLTSLGDPADKLEKSWQFYVQCLISQALGDEVPVLTPAYCKDNGYYHALVSGQFTGIVVLNEEELCDRCLRNRDFGAGVFPTVTKAEFKVLNFAAERGGAKAALIIGDCYFDANGNGVVMNSLEEAFLWYKRAADGGLADAQFMVGACFENGMGCESNETSAISWYKRAADQGVEDAIARVKDLCGNEGELNEDEVELEDDADDEIEGDEVCEDCNEHVYCIEIGSSMLSYGRQRFASREEIELTDKDSISEPIFLDDNDERASLDGAELKVCDEDGNCVFKEFLDCNGPSELEFVNDGELFPDKPEFKDGAVYLFVCIEVEKRRVSKIKFKGGFDASKLTIVYRSIQGHDGETDNVIWDLKYDGNSLDCEFVGSASTISKWSWLEDELECDRKFDVWERPEDEDPIDALR